MKKIRVDIWLYCFIVLCFIILVNDYLTYFFSLPYLVSLLISIGICTPILFKVTKKFQITKDFDKADVIFYILLLFVFAITIVFPDRMFDTLNYHLYSQVHPFNQILTGDFFPSRAINSYTYSFTDRVFYPFRLLFGYRLGLIFNYFCLIIIYYQIKRIVKELNVHNSLVVSLIGVFSIFTFSMLDLADVYYVDYFSIIFLLEIFIHVMKPRSYSIGHLFVFMAFLSGLAFCAKISNAYFILILFFLFLFNYRSYLKHFKWKYLLWAILAFVFPFILYMFYTYIETGNPFFPFYNTIFHSNLYSNTNWMDTRFGPVGLLETLIWPVKMLFDKGRAIDIAVIEPLWAYGYIIAIGYLLYYFVRMIRKKKIPMSKFLFMTFLVLSYIVWASCVLGYTRYGLFLLILSSIAIGLFLIDIIKYKKYFVLPIMIVLLSYHVYYCVYNYVYQGDYYSSNNLFANGVSSYLYNLKQMFAPIEKVDFPENSAWGVVNSNSGYMMLLNDEVPIHSLILSTETSYAEELLEEKLASVKHFYTLFDGIEIRDFISNLNASGYKLKDYYGTYIPSFLNYNNYLYVFEIEKNTDGYVNLYEEFVSREISLENFESAHISYWVGSSYRSRNTMQGEYYTELVQVKDGVLTVLKRDPLTSDGHMIRVDVNVSKDNGERMYIRVVDSAGQEVSDIVVMCLNLEVK